MVTLRGEDKASEKPPHLLRAPTGDRKDPHRVPSKSLSSHTVGLPNRRRRKSVASTSARAVLQR